MRACWGRTTTGCSSLPALPQVLVALATLTVIGLTPLLLWLGFAVISTRDASRGSQVPPKP